MSLPFLVAMYLLDSFPLAMTCLFLAYIVGEAYVNNGFVMMINVTSPEVRSMRNTYAEGGLNMVYSVTGASIATLLLGYCSHDHDLLREALLFAGVVGYLGGAALYFIISRFYPSDLERDRDLPLEDEEPEQAGQELEKSMSHVY